MWTGSISLIGFNLHFSCGQLETMVFLPHLTLQNSLILPFGQIFFFCIYQYIMFKRTETMF